MINTLRILLGIISTLAIGMLLSFVPETAYLFVGKAVIYTIVACSIAIAVHIENNKSNKKE